jgi:hypothetical protein
MITGLLAILLQLAATHHGAVPADASPYADDATMYDSDEQFFDEKADADTAVNAALARARASGKRVIIIMGANWCHDSRALAGWFHTPRFAAMLGAKYEVVYVDAGMPQRRGQARNQHLIKRFKGKKQQGTPYVMVLSPDGKLLNRDDARSWRNAESRTENDIFSYFAK